MKLYPFQEKVLEDTRQFDHVLYALDMGLGKTFVGGEKMIALESKINLIVCQKSKIRDWCDHFRQQYQHIHVCDLTDDQECKYFLEWGHLSAYQMLVGVINYDLIFRRHNFLDLHDFTLMLDESQNIRNEHAKRSRFILKMHPDHVILLSGTPTSGKYEHLWSQCHLLGWEISKKAFWSTYVETKWIEDHNTGFRREIVTGYKNVERLKRKLAQHGTVFMKTAEVIDLPDQHDIRLTIERSREYDKFIKKRYLILPDGTELVGDTSLTKALYARQLCGQYSTAKLDAFADLITSTEKSIIVFYNFNAERDLLAKIIRDSGRPVSTINGEGRDLDAYNKYTNAVTLVQYQAGATGLNLQKSHITVYFTLPFGRGSCALWEQSKKRTHRIGQDQTCLYYYLIVRGSIEEMNLRNLEAGVDYDEALFERES